MKKWLIATVLLVTMALATSSILLIPTIIAGMSPNGVTPKASTEEPKLGHIEFVPATSVVHHDRVQISPEVWEQQVEVSGTLSGSPSDAFVVYANNLGPFGPGKVTWKVETLTPPGYPLSITIVEGGNAIWTSGFVPKPASGYSISESPIFEHNANDIHLIVANNNDASVSYTLKITLTTS